MEYKHWDRGVVGEPTLCFVSISVTIGQNMPARVPTPLDIPISILAYRGAMSKWFTLKPGNINRVIPV